MASSVFRSARARVLPLVAAASMALAPVAEAQSGRMSVIRDAEIEALLRDYATPIFKAAGVGSTDAEIVLVQDSDFNAFVASGRRMVIFTGTLMQSKTPNEVIGVIAHETGHLAGGHLENLHNEVARARAIGAVVTLLGVAGMAAGAATGSTTGAQMGSATATMASGIAGRTLLSYRRAQELAADRAAVKYLDATHQSARGMVTTFERFADQELLSAKFVDPYVQTHPMARDRIAQLETVAKKSRYWDATDDAQLQIRHDLMRAKLAGFTLGAADVARRYPRSDTSLPGQYARAISAAYHSTDSGGRRRALAAIDGLIAAAPDYPYFHELKGQVLLESGDARGAVGPLRKAVALAPASASGLIRIMLGHALQQTGDKGLLDDAVASLKAGLRDEPLDGEGYRYLAMALQQQGKVASAQLATANGLLIGGQVEEAKGFAKRAQQSFSRGSPEWLQSDDIISYEPPQGSKKR